MQQQAQRRRWQLRQLAISAQSNDVAALSRSLLATSILERLGVSYAFRRCGGVLCCFFCRLFISTSAHSACASVRPSGGSSVDLSDGSLGTGRVVLRLETRRNASSFEELRPAFSVQLEDDQQVRRLLLTQTPARQPPILTAAQDPHPPPPLLRRRLDGISPAMRSAGPSGNPVGRDQGLGKKSRLIGDAWFEEPLLSCLPDSNHMLLNRLHFIVPRHCAKSDR